MTKILIESEGSFVGLELHSKITMNLMNGMNCIITVIFSLLMYKLCSNTVLYSYMTYFYLCS